MGPTAFLLLSLFFLSAHSHPGAHNRRANMFREANDNALPENTIPIPDHNKRLDDEQPADSGGKRRDLGRQ